MTTDALPLICHIVHRFDVGGLENGVVNLINRLPRSEFRHAVVALTEATSFAKRVEDAGVQVHALGKPPGKSLSYLVVLYRLLRAMRPAVVHTHNLATLECQAVAWAARVSCRIHGEHGWDVFDPLGRRPRYVWLRRLVDPLVNHYVALSREIEAWLTGVIGVRASKVTRICNGVDVARFHPTSPCRTPQSIVVGTVIRLSDIKDPLNVVESFAKLRDSLGTTDRRAELLIVGDGPLREQTQQRIDALGLAEQVTMAGSQADVVPWLQRMDVFVLGSRREGISNTILEAMACGLPVVATRTGGNVELVDEGKTGNLVPPSDPTALATALQRYVTDDGLRRATSRAARQRAGTFSIDAMVGRYASLYRAELEQS